MEGSSIAAYYTREFGNIYGIWHDFHLLKVLPHGKGVLDERPVVIRWIKRFEAEFAAMQRWELERTREKLPICRAEQRYN